jgi:hypothetical protein
MSQTHWATRRIDQGIESDRVTTDGIEPGLTLRDIRIAVLLENLLDSPGNLIARIPYHKEHRSIDKADAWYHLLSQYPFTNWRLFMCLRFSQLLVSFITSIYRSWLHSETWVIATFHHETTRFSVQILAVGSTIMWGIFVYFSHWRWLSPRQ